MPRRKEPHPLARSIGLRIRELRRERGLTLEELASRTEARDKDRDFSKGHLSSMERGLVLPTIGTLALLADALDVLVVDVVNDPTTGDRAKLIEQSRRLAPGTLRRLTKELATARPRKEPRGA